MAPTKSWGARKDRKPPVALIKVILKLKNIIQLWTDFDEIWP